MINHEAILSQLAAIFNAENIDSVLIEGTKNSWPQLILYLGQDYAKRDRTLTITALKQDSLESPQGADASLFQYARVQFEITLPFKMQSATTYDLGSLLHFINRMLELPGFEMDEVENTIRYRYVLFSTDPASTPSLYISILGIIMMIQDLFVETIERVALGRITFSEVLKEIAALSKEIKLP